MQDWRIYLLDPPGVLVVTVGNMQRRPSIVICPAKESMQVHGLFSGFEADTYTCIYKYV